MKDCRSLLLLLRDSSDQLDGGSGSGKQGNGGTCPYCPRVIIAGSSDSSLPSTTTITATSTTPAGFISSSSSSFSSVSGSVIAAYIAATDGTPYSPTALTPAAIYDPLPGTPYMNTVVVSRSPSTNSPGIPPPISYDGVLWTYTGEVGGVEGGSSGEEEGRVTSDLATIAKDIDRSSWAPVLVTIGAPMPSVGLSSFLESLHEPVLMTVPLDVALLYERVFLQAAIECWTTNRNGRAIGSYAASYPSSLAHMKNRTIGSTSLFSRLETLAQTEVAQVTLLFARAISPSEFGQAMQKLVPDAALRQLVEECVQEVYLEALRDEELAYKSSFSSKDTLHPPHPHSNSPTRGTPPRETKEERVSTTEASVSLGVSPSPIGFSSTTLALWFPDLNEATGTATAALDISLREMEGNG